MWEELPAARLKVKIMADLSLKHIYKVYPNGTKAVNDFNMEIADKEFIVFVGPSGCGKSTTLRMIAGLEDISAGELKIGDLIVNDMEPKDRDIAMVFQNYALYPHMTIYENLAFSLRLRKLPKEELHNRVVNAAEILGLTEYLAKKPKEMSGGQRQRVALGRAIVREPKVMLLDEPLSNLDAKLRTQMRAEIAKLHSRLNTTFIYVTHDQVEAMTMGTRIVVMKDGFIKQIDTPKNLYNYPENKFVAGFIGTPQMNFFEGTLRKDADKVHIDFAYSNAQITVPYSMLYKVRPDYLDGKTPVFIGLRAEDVSVNAQKVKNSKSTVKVRISHKEELGSETLLYGDINMDGDGYSESSTRIIIKDDGNCDCKAGDVIDAALNMERVHLFDKQTEESVLPRLPEYNYLQCTVQNGIMNFYGQNTELPPAMRCADGEYGLLIPTDAISEGGDVAVNVKACEEINGKYLLSAELNGKIIYALVTRKITEDTLKLGIDLKKLTLIKDGEKVIEPMPAVNRFNGSFVKRKVKKTAEINGKTKTVKETEFLMALEDREFVVNDGLARKLFAALGVKKAFTTPLIIECGVYDIKLSDSGIRASAEGVLDYGNEKFLKCKIGENTVYLLTDKQHTGEVYIEPDFDKIGIIETQRDIRII